MPAVARTTPHSPSTSRASTNDDRSPYRLVSNPASDVRAWASSPMVVTGRRTSSAQTRQSSWKRRRSNGARAPLGRRRGRVGSGRADRLDSRAKPAPMSTVSSQPQLVSNQSASHSWWRTTSPKRSGSEPTSRMGWLRSSLMALDRSAACWPASDASGTGGLDR